MPHNTSQDSYTYDVILHVHHLTRQLQITCADDIIARNVESIVNKHPGIISYHNGMCTIRAGTNPATVARQIQMIYTGPCTIVSEM